MKVTHDALHTPNLPHEITVMIINTGQMCTVNYSDRPRIRDLGKKMTYYKKKTRIPRNAVSRLPALFHKIEVNLGT